MSKLLVIGDVHGCYATLMALVNLFPDRKVYLCGDIIDRGPRSKEVLEYAMRNRIPTTLGNHEHMCVCHYSSGGGMYADRIWLHVGGNKTRKSFHGRISSECIAWMKGLPYYIIPENYPELLISHTGHGKTEPDPFESIWRRDVSFPPDGLFRVFGHTPIDEPIITSTYAAIDTGVVDGSKYLTGFLWPEKEVIQQKNIDT